MRVFVGFSLIYLLHLWLLSSLSAPLSAALRALQVLLSPGLPRHAAHLHPLFFSSDFFLLFGTVCTVRTLFHSLGLTASRPLPMSFYASCQLPGPHSPWLPPFHRRRSSLPVALEPFSTHYSPPSLAPCAAYLAPSVSQLCTARLVARLYYPASSPTVKLPPALSPVFTFLRLCVYLPPFPALTTYLTTY